MKTIIVTGLSGSGKSEAMNIFEDMGYYCIDNMPPSLIMKFRELGNQNLDLGLIFADIGFLKIFMQLNNCWNHLNMMISTSCFWKRKKKFWYGDTRCPEEVILWQEAKIFWRESEKKRKR